MKSYIILLVILFFSSVMFAQQKSHNTNLQIRKEKEEILNNDTKENNSFGQKIDTSQEFAKTTLLERIKKRDSILKNIDRYNINPQLGYRKIEHDTLRKIIQRSNTSIEDKGLRKN
tara:strand:- start:706 stop:1053 length:348 start_codon:yes stop_codon:yes gene_type:complete